MKVTAQNRQEYERNARPVYVVNLLGIGWTVFSVAVGVTIGIVAAYLILALLGGVL